MHRVGNALRATPSKYLVSIFQKSVASQEGENEGRRRVEILCSITQAIGAIDNTDVKDYVILLQERLSSH